MTEQTVGDFINWAKAQETDSEGFIDTGMGFKVSKPTDVTSLFEQGVEMFSMEKIEDFCDRD